MPDNEWRVAAIRFRRSSCKHNPSYADILFLVQPLIHLPLSSSRITSAASEGMAANSLTLPQLRNVAHAVVSKDQDVFFIAEQGGGVPGENSDGFGLHYHDCRYLELRSSSGDSVENVPEKLRGRERMAGRSTKQSNPSRAVASCIRLAERAGINRGLLSFPFSSKVACMTRPGDLISAELLGA